MRCELLKVTCITRRCSGLAAVWFKRNLRLCLPWDKCNACNAAAVERGNQILSFHIDDGLVPGG